MFHLISKKPSSLGPRSKTALEAVVLFFFIVFSILAITWPWGSYIDHAFVTHWDPPLHAWKVIGIAKAILAGHILPAATNMNVYYPHPGSLFFESLYWPQAVIAALVFKLSANPILAFNLSYLFFWALSGVCFWFFLREVGVNRLVSYVGAVFFTIMPYRTSYLVEFNMQMSFGIPLTLLFAARYCKNPNVRDAALAAFFLGLQAISELYQAVFLSLCLPFFVMPLLAQRWKIFKSWKDFWLPAIAAGIIGLVFISVYLWPYLLCLDNSLTRPLGETYQHRMEPFSYLVSRDFTRWRLLPEIQTIESEMSAYATLPVLVLVAVFLVWQAAIHLSRENRRENRVALILRAARTLSLVAFFVFSFIHYKTHELLLPSVFSRLPVVIVILSLAIPLFTTYRSNRERLLDGLFGAATFAFFMSLGPSIQCGHKCPFVSNVLYVFLYQTTRVLHGFRVASRFSFFILIFDIVAACCVYTKLIDFAGARKKWGKPILLCALIPLLAVSVYESVPRPLAPNPLPPPKSSVIEHLDAREEPYVLAMIPFGRRAIDSQDMFQIGEDKRLLVWAWGGTFPSYTKLYSIAYGRIFEDPCIMKEYLNTLWPDCFILLRRDHMKRYYKPDKAEAILKQIRLISTVVDDDHENLALLKPMPSAPSTNVLKMIRHDFMQANGSMHFNAELAPGAFSNCIVSVRMNDKEISTFEISRKKQEFTLPYPEKAITIKTPNALRFISDQPISIMDFSLVP